MVLASGKLVELSFLVTAGTSHSEVYCCTHEIRVKFELVKQGKVGGAEKNEYTFLMSAEYHPFRGHLVFDDEPPLTDELEPQTEEERTERLFEQETFNNRTCCWPSKLQLPSNPALTASRSVLVPIWLNFPIFICMHIDSSQS